MLIHVKCGHDNKRMFDLDPKRSLESVIEIKCPHCGTLNRVSINKGTYNVCCIKGKKGTRQ